MKRSMPLRPKGSSVVKKATLSFGRLVMNVTAESEVREPRDSSTEANARPASPQVQMTCADGAPSPSCSAEAS